ncbi:hypothetical protein [Streptomyces sp. LNU-CPARS28]|uniref:hypothetical protein n=1 Tax=Streptomyces sp. LNU-CPARS28 TaxID=3137371 RepID=UPI003134DD35
MTSRPVNHRAVAARLRAQPGVWGLVNTYGYTTSAATVASGIRTAHGQYAAAYGPAGSFETRTVTVLGLSVRVEARYIGDAGAPAAPPEQDQRGAAGGEVG